jgi:hypothetical protein
MMDRAWSEAQSLQTKTAADTAVFSPAISPDDDANPQHLKFASRILPGLQAHFCINKRTFLGAAAAG